jgi:hypothetical protein
MDWQPSGVSWYLGGQRIAFKAPPAPSKPQFTLLSIWSKSDFGGGVPPGHPPYLTTFRDVRRLVCDQPRPRQLQLSGERPAGRPAGWRLRVVHASLCGRSGCRVVAPPLGQRF